MTQLTEEDLAKIYPTPKTYDQLEAEKKQREEEARPKFVALKIASWMTLSVPTVIITWYATRHIVATFRAPSSMAILAGVCLTMLVCIAGLAILYYLWWLIEKLAYKTMVATSLFKLIAVSVLAIAGAVGALFFIYEYNVIVIAAVTMPLVFASGFIATKTIK